MPVPLEQLRELIITLLPRLRRFAHAITGRAHSADDAVQLCIERALVDWAQWHSSRQLESGLFSMLAGMCAISGDGRPQGVDPGPADHAAMRADDTLTAALRRTYASLPLQQRVAIALVVLEKVSYAQTAAILELPLTKLTEQLWCACERLQAGPHFS